MYGTYESVGLLEAQYAPYEGVGADGDSPDYQIPPPPEAGAGVIGDAVAAAMCVAVGGRWNDQTRQCEATFPGQIPVVVPPGETGVDQAFQAFCVSNGYTWDPATKTCNKPEQSTTTSSTIWWLAAGAAVVGAIWYTSSKKR